MGRFRQLVTAPARILTYLYQENGTALGWWLGRELPDDERRRLAMSLLRNESVVLEFEADGFAWRMPTGDEITREVFATGTYSGPEAMAIGRWVRNEMPDRHGRTVLEVGANVGTTTLPLAREGWNVVACEPMPATFTFLTHNVAANKLHVSCLQRAIGGEDGEVLMDLRAAHGSSRVSATGSVRVPMCTLGTLMAELGLQSGDIAFVWCDAEGCEAGVIAGGASLWRAGVPCYTEIEPGDAELVREVLTHFESFGQFHEGMLRLQPIERFAAWAESLKEQADVLLVQTPAAGVASA